MGNALKYLKWTVLGVIGLVVATVVFLVIWIDPNDYRDDASKLVKEKTGLILVINGKIGWQVYPAIGFSVEGITLAPGEGQPEIAGIGKAAVSVELLPLLQKQVNVRTLFLDGLKANLIVDANGKGNWEALSKGDAAAPEPVPEDTAKGEAPLIRVPKVEITNSSLVFDDEKAHTRKSVTLKEFTGENVGLGQEFPIHVVAAMEDEKGMKVAFDLKTFLTLNPDTKLFNVRGLALDADIAGILKEPFKTHVETDVIADMQANKIGITRLSVDASNLAVTAKPLNVKIDGPITVDLAADTADVGPMKFSAAGVNGTLAVNAKNATGKLATEEGTKVAGEGATPEALAAAIKAAGEDPARALSFSGTLDIPTFNAKNAMREVGIAPPVTADQMAMTKVAFKTAFAGSLKNAMANDIVITLDDTHVTGKAGITDLLTKALVFDLNIDGINADRYLPPATAAATPAPAAPAAKPGPLLPVETLRTLNIDGKLAIGKVTMMDWPMTNLGLTVKAGLGDVRLDPFKATVLEGSVGGNVRIDVRGDTPHITTNLKIDRVEIGGVVKRIAKKDLLNGKTSLNLGVDTVGNDMDAIIKHLNGKMDLSLADATLKGANLNNIVTDMLKQKLGAFAMLMPDYQDKLPRELQQDTQFKTFKASGTIKDGIATIPSFAATIPDGNIKGSGQFNLAVKDFDYTLLLHTDKLKDNKYLANVDFPVRCKGNIAGAPADWCRPDGGLIGDAIKNAAEKAGKERLKGEIAKRLGVESVDTEALKAEAQKQADAKIAEAKAEAEAKAKEEANKQLQKALKKFF